MLDQPCSVLTPLFFAKTLFKVGITSLLPHQITRWQMISILPPLNITTLAFSSSLWWFSKEIFRVAHSDIGSQLKRWYAYKAFHLRVIVNFQFLFHFWKNYWMDKMLSHVFKSFFRLLVAYFYGITNIRISSFASPFNNSTYHPFYIVGHSTINFPP